MKVVRHLFEQPFIVATGLAALIHSTWSLGTLFAGHEPAFGPAYIAWLIPALLIAFSLDIGQIVTSAEIRRGERRWAKYATFGTFALATYYLQWLYIASHMPAIDLAPGVRETWAGTAQLLRDAAVWIIPALLPLSTWLYTLSYTKPNKAERTPERTEIPGTALVVVAPVDSSPIGVSPVAAVFPANCLSCGWHGEYTSEKSAQAALRAHSRRCSEVAIKAQSLAHSTGD